MEEVNSKSVEVTNISPNAHEKTVSDFFSFCGKISKLYMKRDEVSQTSSAVVEFETESAAKTALLLTNALIVDRPIVVVSYTFSPTADQSNTELLSRGTAVPESEITQRNFGEVPDEHRSKTSVVASLIASGYIVASDALSKAKDYDEKHMILLQAKVAMEQIKIKAHEIDKQYGISEKATAVKQQAAEKAKKLDGEYKISEKAATAASSVKATAMQASAMAQENPTINSGMDSVKSGWASMTQSVTGFYNDYKEQTAKAIEEKKKEKMTQGGQPPQQGQPQQGQPQQEQPQQGQPPQIVPEVQSDMTEFQQLNAEAQMLG